MDRMIRCITSNGAIMAAAVDSTYLVATAHQVHNTSPVATAALGRLLTGASIMGSMLKKENATLTLKINGGGPLGSVVAIADSHGNCRGYVEHPEVDLPLKPNGKLDVGRAVGNDGLLGVLRDFGEGQPYMGQVEIISGEIAEDITHYYATSEQIPTVCALGVLVGKEDKNQILAGGLLIQVLPGASEADIDQLEKNISTLEPVTTMLAKGMTIEEMCKTALQGFEMEILDEFQMSYVCTCSKERVRNALITLRPEELRTLADESGKMEAKCQYCNRSYQFTAEELETLAESLEIKRADKN
ncbi:Hsp33 family molecular chaperone HslO [Clostridium sp. D33t1_170424_F3]|uniref:Hsp33 family molecular chaperone HslO n=1 Tax=Clostridium sp. D33t1_170424_F3 TaxID=2787099 RepID=UPI0018AB0A81|nr:Hsp33 family molecular chaperone HslO [Clostridium sp. D33t1_170424_F3]